MVGVIRAALALPGHKEAHDEAQHQRGHAGGRHGHRELLGAVATWEDWDYIIRVEFFLHLCKAINDEWWTIIREGT